MTEDQVGGELERQDEDPTRRLEWLEREIARTRERLASAHTALYHAEHKLRSLVPQTRTAQHAVGMYRSWLETVRLHHDDLRELVDERNELEYDDE